MTIITDTDFSWKDIAEGSRRALRELRHDVPACLPGEPDECGGGFAVHTMAYLATLRARVDFEIEHLGPDAAPAIGQIYEHVLADIRTREGNCGIGDHQPAPEGKI